MVPKKCLKGRLLRLKHIIMCGLTGKTGRAVAQQIQRSPDFEIVAAVGKSSVGQDIGEVLEGRSNGRKIFADLESALAHCEADVYIDFSTSTSTEMNGKVALAAGLDVIIGTTDLSKKFVSSVKEHAQSSGQFAILSSNFSLGTAVIAQAAKTLTKLYVPDRIEITETHHQSKVDQPSGTALYLKEQITSEQIPVEIYSIRVPDKISKHELVAIFNGEILSITHEVTDPKVFGEGVLFVLQNYQKVPGFYRDVSSFIAQLDEH